MGKLKNLFIKVDDEETVEEETKVTSTPRKGKVVEEEVEEVSVSGKASTSDIKKMADYIAKALSDNSSEGFDYLKFREAVQDLVKDGTPEESAMKAVFSTAKKMNGATKKKLVDSINTAIDTINNEKKNFVEELKGRKQAEITDIDARIKEIDSEMTSLGREKEKLEKNLAASKVKINNTEFAFNEAAQTIAEKIKADLSKITNILGD